MLRLDCRQLVVPAVALLLLLGCQGPPKRVAASAEVGEALYALKRCSTCHAIDGKGGAIGCDLTRVARRRNQAWMERWLADPQAVRPGTRMPNMGLKEDEVRAIAAYLATRR